MRQKGVGGDSAQCGAWQQSLTANQTRTRADLRGMPNLEFVGERRAKTGAGSWMFGGGVGWGVGGDHQMLPVLKSLNGFGPEMLMEYKPRKLHNLWSPEFKAKHGASAFRCCAARPRNELSTEVMCECFQTKRTCSPPAVEPGWLWK